jgi:hypothetical protein
MNGGKHRGHVVVFLANSIFLYIHDGEHKNGLGERDIHFLFAHFFAHTITPE